MTEGVRLDRFDVEDPLHGAVPCARLVPARVSAETPLCLFLYGGGGSRETLAEIAPVVERWWREGRVPEMVLATPDVGPFGFYLDDPARGTAWETLTAERLVAHVRASLGLDGPLGVVGISMGGYGALKIALARPHAFRAVAAISPMIEPGEDAAAIPLRNRFHYPPEVPQALLGPARDADLYRRDHPAARARASAEALRRGELAIAIDAAGEDALHAHDGAEHLHRVLWDLDVAHEYHLRRDADHVGADLLDRIGEALSFVGRHLAPRAPVEDPARAALRAHVAPLRAAAEARDPTMLRRYGRLG